MAALIGFREKYEAVPVPEPAAKSPPQRRRKARMPASWV